jgi:hypothetical protein
MLLNQEARLSGARNKVSGLSETVPRGSVMSTRSSESDCDRFASRFS